MPSTCACAGINWIKQGDNWPANDPFNRGVPNVPAGYPEHFSGNFWWASAAFWHTLPDGFLGALPGLPIRVFCTTPCTPLTSRCRFHTTLALGQPTACMEVQPLHVPRARNRMMPCSLGSSRRMRDCLTHGHEHER